MATKFKLAVCLVDDDQGIRAAFEQLAKVQGFKLASFSSANEFLLNFTPKNVGCILLDVQMPGMSGLELQEILHQRKTPIPIIVLTGHANIPVAVKAVKNGALDVLEKPIKPDVLMDKLQHAFKIFSDWQKVEQERQEIGQRLARLTPREVEVMDLMAEGMKNQMIAKHLGISRKTLDIHRGKVIDKMKARTWADLTRWRLLHQSGPGGVCKIEAGGFV